MRHAHRFVSVSRKNFPNAKIFIDPFYIVKRLGDIVDDIRFHYQHQFQYTGDTESLKKLKGIIRLLKTRKYNQVKYWGARFHDNKQRLQDAFDAAPDILEIYDSLQFFYDILASWLHFVQHKKLTNRSNSIPPPK